jgi:hypothetical protein
MGESKRKLSLQEDTKILFNKLLKKETPNEMNFKSQNEYFSLLTSEYTKILIENTVWLIEAVKTEEFELAAGYKHRIKEATHSVILQSNILLGVPMDILKEHFDKIVNQVFDSVDKEFKKNK